MRRLIDLLIAGLWGINLLFLPTAAHAQNEFTWEEFMQELSEDHQGETDEQEWEAQMETLSELHENPIDINQATFSQLEALPFLSEEAVKGIMDYISLNGPMRTLGELRLIRSLNVRECDWLRLFLTINPETTVSRDTTRGWWGRTRHEALTRLDVPLYKRDGWSWARGIAHRMRYTWQQGQHLDVGLRASKDAGEALFTRELPIWDSYGGHVMLKDLGPVKRVIIGDFKAGFGEGLVINKGLLFGKTTMGLWRTTNGLRPHRSADESSFLRGAAATMALGRGWEVTALYSIRYLDATVNKNNSVSTINTTGLHRTATELQRRHTLQSQTSAIHASWHHKRWQAGATALFQYYDHQFVQGDALYRQIYPVGYLFGNVSVNYGYHTSRLMLRGETARSFDSRGGGWATLNKAVWRFNATTQLAAIQRLYSRDYYSPHASAFGENSRVQNESGVALLFDAERLGPFGLRAFFDYFYSPWPRYTMTRYSTGWEGLVQTTWQPRRGRQLVLRYRVKSKEQSDRRHYSHQVRATYSHSFTSQWSTVLSALLNRYHEPAESQSLPTSNSTGWALAPQARFQSRNERLKLTLTAIFFHTDDYSSRLYLYEPSLYQTFGLQQLYGRGQRLALTCRYTTPNRRWMLQTKVGATHYTDRSEISSGPLHIASSWKTDVQVLLRMKF